SIKPASADAGASGIAAVFAARENGNGCEIRQSGTSTVLSGNLDIGAAVLSCATGGGSGLGSGGSQLITRDPGRWAAPLLAYALDRRDQPLNGGAGAMSFPRGCITADLACS